MDLSLIGLDLSISTEFGTHFLRTYFQGIVSSDLGNASCVPCVPYFSQDNYDSLAQVMEKVIPGKCLKLC